MAKASQASVVVIRVFPVSTHGLGARQCYTTLSILPSPGYIVASLLQTMIDLHRSLVTPLPCCRCVVRPSGNRHF